jgi:tetratricopeptide (TPR) repeat protein
LTTKHHGKAVIFCLKDDLRTAIRTILKTVGFEAADVHNVRSVKEYQAKGKELKDGFLLILDWDVGVENVFEIFKAEEKDKYAYTVPVMLIASKADEKILGVATEFNIAKIHMGEITPELIKGTIQEFAAEGLERTALKTLYMEVDKLRKAESWDKAGKVLEELTKKFPENEKLHIDYAETLFEQGMMDEARGVLEKIKSPKNARAKHMQARVLLAQGDAKKAVAALEDAQLLNPYNINRLLEMGNLFLDMSDPEKAKGAFDQVLKVAPESKPAKGGKSSSLLLSGEINEAISIIKETFSPRETAAVFNTSAILAIKEKMFPKAIDLYKTAIQFIGPNSKIKSRIYYNMGIGHYKADEGSEALNCFSQAVKLDGGFQAAKHNLELMLKKDSNKLSVSEEDDGLGNLEESIGRAAERGLASTFADLEDVEE